MRSINSQVVTVNGKINADLTRLAFDEALNKLISQESTDYDLVHEAVQGFLLANPGMKSAPTSTFVNRAYDLASARIRAEGGGDLACDEARKRLEKVTVPEYFRADGGDHYHVSKKLGVCIRFVEGETDDSGNQIYRTDDETWSKLTAPKAPKASE